MPRQRTLLGAARFVSLLVALPTLFFVVVQLIFGRGFLVVASSAVAILAIVAACKVAVPWPLPQSHPTVALASRLSPLFSGGAIALSIVVQASVGSGTLKESWLWFYWLGLIVLALTTQAIRVASSHEPARLVA